MFSVLKSTLSQSPGSDVSERRPTNEFSVLQQLCDAGTYLPDVVGILGMRLLAARVCRSVHTADVALSCGTYNISEGCVGHGSCFSPCPSPVGIFPVDS